MIELLYTSGSMSENYLFGEEYSNTEGQGIVVFYLISFDRERNIVRGSCPCCMEPSQEAHVVQQVKKHLVEQQELQQLQKERDSAFSYRSRLYVPTVIWWAGEASNRRLSVNYRDLYDSKHDIFTFVDDISEYIKQKFKEELLGHVEKVREL